ncbi:MAG: phosphate ABC transporter permease PstA [Actinomycetota bacterium]
MAVTDAPTTQSPQSEEIRQQLHKSDLDLGGKSFQAALLAALLFALVILIVLIYTVLDDGLGVILDRPTDFLGSELRSRADETGVFKALRGTFWIGVFTAVIAFPTGIAAAIYLEEYAPKNRLTTFISVNIRNLAGVPSVVYGILGFSIFVGWFSGFAWLFPGEDTGGVGKTTAAAGVTLATLALPIVIITSAEALRSVPQALREASYGVGATKWQTIRNHLLPYAAPGILTGTLLALADALGQAAPLILVGAIQGRLGADEGFFELGQLSDQFTAMPIMIAVTAGRPGDEWAEITAATIIILLGVVLVANATAILLRNRFEKKREGA